MASEVSEVCSEVERSPTERVRAMLDERGVEYNTLLGPSPETVTYFDLPDGREVGYTDFGDGHTQLRVWNATPEQAIAATVGRSCASCPEMDNPDSYICHLHRALEVADKGAGTCRIETTEGWLPAERYHRCKHCGAFFAVLDASSDIPPRACPNCGRRIIEEATE